MNTSTLHFRGGHYYVSMTDIMWNQPRKITSYWKVITVERKNPIECPCTIFATIPNVYSDRKGNLFSIDGKVFADFQEIEEIAPPKTKKFVRWCDGSWQKQNKHGEWKNV